MEDLWKKKKKTLHCHKSDWNASLFRFSYRLYHNTLNKKKKIRAKEKTKEEKEEGRLGFSHVPEGYEGEVVMAEIEIGAAADGSEVARVSDWENEMRELLRAKDWEGIGRVPSKSDAMAAALLCSG